MIEIGLVAARFLHLAAAMCLFGLALFPLYSFPCHAGAPARISRLVRAPIRYAALLGLLSALAWCWFAIASMTGSIMAAADSDNLLTVLLETSFGRVWIVRLVLAVLLLALTTRRANARHPEFITVLLAGLLLASLAFVGHTQSNEGALRAVHMSADGAHLLAGGAWLGGLLALGCLLMLARKSPAMEDTALTVNALLRFSRMGYAAVAILLSSGLVNAWILLDAPVSLITTPYGQLLLAKACLFAVMLALAAQNRFRAIPQLLPPNEAGLPPQSLLRLLRRNAIGEYMLGLAIVMIVGWLGTMSPAR